MAAAEAKASLHSIPRGCVVPEGPRLDPKLSSDPSSSSSLSSSMPKGAPGIAANHGDKSTPSYVFNGPKFDYTLREANWWLHLQPNIEQQKDYTYERTDASDTSFDILSSDIHKTAKDDKYYHVSGTIDSLAGMKNGVDFSLEDPSYCYATFMKNYCDDKDSGFKAGVAVDPCTMIGRKYESNRYTYGQYMEMDYLDSFASEQTEKLCSEVGPLQKGGAKTDPWWRSATRDELASLVAQKSLENFMNCDLPLPQNRHLRNKPSKCSDPFELQDRLPSSGCPIMNRDFRDLMQANGTPTLLNINVREETAHTSARIEQGFDGSHSCREPHSPTNDFSTENLQAHDSTKSQLLEALCHSQKRAREAEAAAEQANTEKDHLVALFFRQASQLFAYKQWFQLLQLENLYNQLKTSNQPISDFFPPFLPWAPLKRRQMKGPLRRAGKRQHPARGISKCAAGLIGFVIAGAGLLLGWTMGWLFPAF